MILTGFKTLQQVREEAADYPSIIDSTDCCLLLGKSERSLRYYVNKKGMPKLKYPGAKFVRYNKDDVIAWGIANGVIIDEETAVEILIPAAEARIRRGKKK